MGVGRLPARDQGADGNERRAGDGTGAEPKDDGSRKKDSRSRKMGRVSGGDRGGGTMQRQTTGEIRAERRLYINQTAGGRRD
jgi:hypothetical protein